MKSWFVQDKKKAKKFLIVTGAPILPIGKSTASVCRRKARRLPAHKLWPAPAVE